MKTKAVKQVHDQIGFGAPLKSVYQPTKVVRKGVCTSLASNGRHYFEFHMEQQANGCIALHTIHTTPRKSKTMPKTFYYAEYNLSAEEAYDLLEAYAQLVAVAF